jgi:two-component system sensor histidine kinase KdpD
MRAYALVILAMAACTGLGTLLLPHLSVTDVAMLFLLTVGLVAARGPRRAAVFAAILSVACFDFFFVPPRFTFAVNDLHYVITFAVMLVTALVIGRLVEQVRTEAVATRERERGTAALYPMAAELLDVATVDDTVAVIRKHVRAAFDADARILLRQTDSHLTATDGGRVDPTAEWAFQTWESAGVGTGHFVTAPAVYLPLLGSHGRLGVLEVRPDRSERLTDPAVQWLLRTFAAQAALALERAQQAARV